MHSSRAREAYNINGSKSTNVGWSKVVEVVDTVGCGAVRAQDKTRTEEELKARR